LKRPGFLIVWPAHLDSSKTRGEGRRLPVSRAVKQPSVKEVWQAAMTLGYSPETTEKAALSKSPWEKTGYVAIKKAGPRPVVLKNIAGEIVRSRQKEAQTVEPKKR
jgi:signal recognition particle subunit SRP19